MISIDKQTDSFIETTMLDSIAKSLTTKDIELILCDNKKIRALNKQYRGIDKATDVLSFPLEAILPNMPLGSIVISLDYVHKGAKEFGHTPQEELALLFIHGTLHLLGFDHEIDQGQMRQEEYRLIKQFNLPDSLIVRTEKGEKD